MASVEDRLRYHRNIDAKNMHWTTSFLVERVIESGEGMEAYKKRVGLAPSVFYHWRKGICPTMQTLEPALKALGYKLAIVPIYRSEDYDGDL